jgi:hypothetical protein
MLGPHPWLTTSVLVEEMFPVERDSSSLDELAPQPTVMKASVKGKHYGPQRLGSRKR